MGEAKRRSAAGTVLRRLYAPSTLAPLSKFVLPTASALPQRAPPAEVATLAESVRARVRAALVRGSAERSLERMIQAIRALGEDCAEAFGAALAAAAARDAVRGRDLHTVACRRGCAFCCHVDVLVTPLEAIRLAHAADFPAAAPSAVRRPPCPLLVDGACSQYERRPYACRAVFSPDAGRCEAGFLSDGAVVVPSLDWPRELAAGYISGELAALADLKLESHMVELRRALAVLAEDKGAALRWLNGGQVFPRRAP